MTVRQVPSPNAKESLNPPPMVEKHVHQLNTQRALTPARVGKEPGRLDQRAVRYVKGVGPQRMQQLVQLGIETIEDACYYAPRRHEDRTRLLTIRELKAGDVATVRARILAKGVRRLRRGQTIFQAAVGDASGRMDAVWFNSPYLDRQLKVRDDLILHGRVDARPKLQMVHPEFERIEKEDDAGSTGPPLALSDRGELRGSLHMGRIVPIYPVTEGLSQRWFRHFIATILEQYSRELQEVLPASIRQSRGWPGVTESVRELHFPSSWDALNLSRQRLAFDELFVLQVALAQRRAQTLAKTKPQRYVIDGPLSQALRQRLPFALTASQHQVLEELLQDLRQSYPMYRLLQGDVGCGKTIILVFLIAVAVQSGYQVALMAPTELLAEQHARVISGYLASLQVSVALLSQSVPAPERHRLYEAIASGNISVIIGTHALIQRPVVFKKLSLVIIDEQHKFGVVQRAYLAKKADVPDVLVLTATPIPRTLALSIYGDLAASTITEMPPGRRPIDTLWMREAQRPELYRMIHAHLGQGRQGYIVYPLVTERQTTDLKAATQMAKRLQAEVFPGVRIGLLHGQMKPNVKERTMAAFARGDLPLLVSTVIVEVGLDVPNATMMVIEHPERFGLAQLHQLRGRIGRGSHPATCFVITDTQDEAVRERLKAFVKTTDGFQLAEKDLELRGPGALFGKQQHGWRRFRIADLARDRLVLESAREEAQQLIAHDPALRDPAVAVLRAQLARVRQHPG